MCWKTWPTTTTVWFWASHSISPEFYFFICKVRGLNWTLRTLLAAHLWLWSCSTWYLQQMVIKDWWILGEECGAAWEWRQSNQCISISSLETSRQADSAFNVHHLKSFMSINWSGSFFAVIGSSKHVTDLSHICCHTHCPGVQTPWEKACQLCKLMKC